ncbi:MAG TPA: Maf family protein [Ilumatobacteraceae bacterium]|nr:Maf family protein [Ilumatobacteraceae bacterium]
MRLVLASGSPRRRELLALLGLPFDVVAPDVDESVRRGEAPTDLVRRLAIDKVEAVEAAGAIEGPDVVVLAADTIVEVAGEILGKPADADDARRMLRALSARTHRVHTGVAVRRDGDRACEVVTTSVTMAMMSDAAIEWYLATGEPIDKAGAYAIQGAGGVFVAAIEGSASNVVGLPLTTVVELLGRYGVAVAGGIVAR